MDSTPQQPGEGDRLEAVLRGHHKLARQFDVSLKDLADYFQENLPDATRHLLSVVPQQMEAWQQDALRSYGYDLERHESAPGFEESVKSAEDAQGLTITIRTDS